MARISLLLPALASVFLFGQDPAGANLDDHKLNEIFVKRGRGEPLTPEEQEFQKTYQAHVAREFAKRGPPRDSIGLVPITELATRTYKGEQGGLYPGGENVPPAAHLKAGLALAKQIAPLSPAGRKTADGRIVLLSLGMSNTTMEFQTFQKLAAQDKALNPNLTIVDGAQGGQVAAVTADPESNFWHVVDQRLEQAGVTPEQVQVVWLLGANPGPWRPFPVEAKKPEGFLIQTMQIARKRFPSLKIGYISSRNYAGYATTPLNPEPHAYESGFAVKWMIASQIAGDPELNYEPARGPARCPWLAWGPYLWADGIKANKEGLSYVQSDFGQDGTHPSMPGREKVARRLLNFLKTDATARPWFVRPE